MPGSATQSELHAALTDEPALAGYAHIKSGTFIGIGREVPRGEAPSNS